MNPDHAAPEADDDQARWALLAARAADDKLATDICVIDVGDVLAICDHFVVATGSNPRQVRAIAEAVEEQLSSEGGPKPKRIEGWEDAEWVLMDFGGFVVHVFRVETREYYDLDRLFRDRAQLDWRAEATG